MLKRIIFPALALLGLLIALTLLTWPQRAAAQVATIPSRTPTPGPVTPTNIPSPDPTSPPQPTSPPPATDTPVPAATATNTAVPPTLDPSITLPTAAVCGEPPTIQTANSINVRSGPGTDYPILSTLIPREVRVIVGRAEFAEWWVILLADGREGWVADFTVTVHGYTGNAPLVAAPLLNGNTPTPGPPWQPTPQPGCPTATPTPEPTATATPTQTPTATTTVDSASVTVSPAVPDAPTQTPPAPPEASMGTVAPQATEDQPAGSISSDLPPAATAVPLNSDTEGGGSNWLLIAGIFLIFTGVVGVVVLRRR